MGDVINLFFVCVCSWWPPVLRVIVWARISLFGPLVELCVCVLYFWGFFFLFWLYFDFHLFCFSFDRIWGSRMSFTRKPSSSASTNCVNAQPAKSRNYWLWRPTLMATATRAVTPASLLLTAWSSPVSSRWNVVTSATSFCADSCTKDSSVTVSLICQLIGKQRRTSKSWPNFIFFYFFFWNIWTACGLIAHRTCSATGLPACLQGLPERANRLHNRTGLFFLSFISFMFRPCWWIFPWHEKDLRNSSRAFWVQPQTKVLNKKSLNVKVQMRAAALPPKIGRSAIFGRRSQMQTNYLELSFSAFFLVDSSYIWRLFFFKSSKQFLELGCADCRLAVIRPLFRLWFCGLFRKSNSGQPARPLWISTVSTGRPLPVPRL